MKCVECESTTTTFDERMGETICADCGLILSVNIFEETSKTVFIKNNDMLVYTRTYDLNRLGSIIEKKDVKSITDYSLRTTNIRTNRSESENKVLIATGIYLS